MPHARPRRRTPALPSCRSALVLEVLEARNAPQSLLDLFGWDPFGVVAANPPGLAGDTVQNLQAAKGQQVRFLATDRAHQAPVSALGDSGPGHQPRHDVAAARPAPAGASPSWADATDQPFAPGVNASAMELALQGFPPASGALPPSGSA